MSAPVPAAPPAEAPVAEEAVCRVCGGVLGPPQVHCPACSSPHHQDCWSYNGGCAIYGCGATEAELPAPVPAAPEVAPPAGLSERLLLEVAGASLLLYVLHLLGLDLLGKFAGAALVVAAWRRYLASQETVDLGALPPPPDDRERLALETKAVVGLLGRDSPAELAQAYALFEQRRPRDRLPGEAQEQLGRELAAGGYPVLAAEALEKCGAAAVEGAPPELAGLYRELFAGDPAFLPEARGEGRQPPPLEAGALLGPGPHYLVSLDPQGFPAPWRRSYRLPTEGAKAPLEKTRWVAGPFPEEELAARLGELEAAGHPALPLRPEELDLPPRVEPLVAVALTSKGARLVTEEGDHAYAWGEVWAVAYERIQRIETRRVLASSTRRAAGTRGGQVTTFHHKTRQDRHADSVLEVHAGEPLRRFRIEAPRPGMFAYLGRRRELAYEPNLRFAAKDVVRFAPHARASRGLVAMFSERQAGAVVFRDRRELEDALLAWHGLGAARIRAHWAGLAWP